MHRRWLLFFGISWFPAEADNDIQVTVRSRNNIVGYPELYGCMQWQHPGAHDVNTCKDTGRYCYNVFRGINIPRRHEESSTYCLLTTAHAYIVRKWKLQYRYIRVCTSIIGALGSTTTSPLLWKENTFEKNVQYPCAKAYDEKYHLVSAKLCKHVNCSKRVPWNNHVILTVYELATLYWLNKSLRWLARASASGHWGRSSVSCGCI